MELSTTDVVNMDVSEPVLKCPSRQHFGVKWEKRHGFSPRGGVKPTNGAFQRAVEAQVEMINEKVNMSFC